MASAPHSSLHMSSRDLIKKEPMDYGGFGEVYLCYHVTLGQVVLKTVYTGPLRNEENKKSLLDEGTLMASLNHERVVKLLGVIMEDSDCSLVMELLPRGNLLVMLETVSVPISVKGRIIVEILEAMVYLTERHIIHKDIKPENILVDKEFHIKVADLGLAICQAWSKLTKEESRRKSRKGQSAVVRGAGTLSYMAPEHLESIHTVSTEKSDVYSFAIVVWVILTGEEPYANARSEDHICQCVRKGDRPAEDLIPENTPLEIIQLMKRCWDHNPALRPTFKESYDVFLPFYRKMLEPYVEDDLLQLRELYAGPDDLVEKIKSLSVTSDCSMTDCPASLLSSDRDVSDPIEASIEDLNDHQYGPSMEYVQADARVPSALEEKLDREFRYHEMGRYSCEDQPYATNGSNVSNPFLTNYGSMSDQAVRQPEPDRPCNVSSVQSWYKTEPVQPTSQMESLHRPTDGLYDSMSSSTAASSHLPMSASTSCLTQLNQQHPHSLYDRHQSWPAYPVSDTLAPSKNNLQQDPGSLVFQNVSGVQIGNNNTMTIRGPDSCHSLSSQTSNGTANSLLREAIMKNEDHVVTEEHLDLLQENIGKKWKNCARRLGLTDVEIETIEHDNFRDGLPEMVHQMLDRWRMKEGSIGCTVGKLCRALDGNIKVDVIQKILDSCNS